MRTFDGRKHREKLTLAKWSRLQIPANYRATPITPEEAQARSCYHTWLAIEQTMKSKTSKAPSNGETEHAYDDKAAWGFDEGQSFEKQEAADERRASGLAKKAEAAAKRAEAAISARRGSYQEEHAGDQKRLNAIHKAFKNGIVTIDAVHRVTWTYVTKRYQRMSTTKELRVFKGTPLAETVEDFAGDLALKLRDKAPTVAVDKYANYVEAALKNDVIDARKHKAEVFKQRGALSELTGFDEDGTVFIGQGMTVTETEDEDNVQDAMRTVEFRAPRSTSVLPVDDAGASAPVPDSGSPDTVNTAEPDDLLCRAEDAVIKLKPESLEVFQCMRGGDMTNKEIAEKFGMTKGIIDRFVRLRRQELERLQQVEQAAEYESEHENVTVTVA